MMATQFTADEVRTAIATQHWNLDFDQFCAALDLNHDAYAEQKWYAFKGLAFFLSQLDTLFDRLLGDYIAQGHGQG